MGLSQATLDQMGRDAFRMYGTMAEAVTYHQKAGLDSTPALATVTALIDEYRGIALATEAVLPTDRRARLLVAQVPWTPSDYDELVRADGSVWRVQSSTGGIGHSFYILQLRQVA